MKILYYLSGLFSRIERPDGHLGGLDALRFLSVFLIFLSHSGFRSFGGYGVPILMALSGFLITRQLMGEYDRRGSIRIDQFLVGRALRIAPAYFLFVGVTYYADHVTGNPWPPELLWYSVTHTVNYFNATHGHPGLSIAHVWTLSVLEQFYFIWPFIFYFIASSKKMITMILLFIALSLGWRLYAYFYLFSQNYSWIYNSLDCRLDSVLVGCLFAVLFYDRNVFFKKVPVRFVIVILVSVVFISVSNKYKPWHYSFGYLFEAVFAMLIVLSVSSISRFRAFSWIDSKLFSWLGKISYSIFLYHILSIGVARKLVDDIYGQLLLAILIAILAAAGSYYVVEAPALKLREKIRRGWRSPQVSMT